MRILLMGVLLAIGMCFGAGCATPGYSSGSPTIVFPEEPSSGEHANHIIRIWALESKQLAEDVDLLLLLDAPSRLTRWNVR